MKHGVSAAALLLALVAGTMALTSARAQIPGFPMGGMPNITPGQDGTSPEDMMIQFGQQLGLDPEALRNATPEQREEMLSAGSDAMAEEMMLNFGAQMGLDPEALRNATPEQREEMLDAASKASTNRMIQQLEARIGMPVDAFKKLSEEEQASIFTGRSQAAGPSFEPMPLPASPDGGFFDGSTPLPVAADYTAVLAVDEPAGREFLLVVADIVQRQIVFRETRTAPFEERLNLRDIAPEPSGLVVELIDPETRLVVQRYRPVAAANE